MKGTLKNRLVNSCFGLCLGLFFFVGCKPLLNVSSRNLASSYRNDVSLLNPQYVIYHSSESQSEFHFKIKSKELLYARLGNDKFFTARLLISYKLYSSYESLEIIDSSSIKLIDEHYNEAENDVVGKILFKANYGNRYLLEVNVKDLNRSLEQSTYLPIDKLNKLVRQNFIVINSDERSPLFNNYLKSGDKVMISSKNKMDSLFVRYYKRNFPFPAPPFAETQPIYFEYKADSTFILKCDSNNNVSFQLSKEGFYHFQCDTIQKNGLTLFRFNDEFPEFGSAEQLLSPLRYITSREEFEEMEKSKNAKSEVDNFWLNISSSKERAKEIIRKFYNRVKESNTYFTSYLEGWKSDRGLVYIIFGYPNTVYKSTNYESWTYGETNNVNSFTFNFVKVINPFTENDFILDRSPIYKNNWYKAVDAWRQGRAY